jgi:hypothetical protein
VRTLPCLIAVLSALSTADSAQTIRPGTIEVSGSTGIGLDRQTASTADASGQLQSTGTDVTTVDIGFEGLYFVMERFGLGALLSHRRLSVEVPYQSALARVASSLFGPIVQFRTPVGGRSQLVVVGSFGGATIDLVNQNTGVGNNLAVTGTGKYWLAGGGMSATLNSATSFDVGVRYENSTFDASGGGKTTAAGLLVRVGFSLYFQR